MKTRITLLYLFCAFTSTVTGQHLNVNWTRFIGPDSCCAELYDAIPTKDGGIVFTGITFLAGLGDIPTTTFGGGVIVGKIDSNHNLLWVHVYGGQVGKSICQTPDGGYAVLAYTGDIGATNGDITGYMGNGDMWLIRIDSLGNFLWGTCYGSDSFNEEALSIATTQDNGFILLGISNGTGQDVPFHLGGSEFEFDWFVVKTDSLGNKQWVNDLGGSNDEATNNYGSILTADNSYYLISSSYSTDYDCSDNSWHSSRNTQDDYYILKLDSGGHVLWSKSFGGSGYDEVYNAVLDPRDSSLIVTGTSTSNDFMVTGNPAGNGMWTIKVDKNGSLIWEKTLGETYGCGGTSVAINTDSGYVLLGTTAGYPGSGNNWIFTLDNSGNIISDTLFGGTGGDASSIVFPFNQGFIATGRTYSNSFTQGNNYGKRGSGGECFISYITCCPNPVSIQNFKPNKEDLLISPNPANNMVEINAPQQGYISITNAIGKTIFKQYILEKHLNLNVKNWNKGIYIVRWQGEDGTTLVEKLVCL